MANAGFEYNIYGDKTKCEVKPLTPNQKARTSVKEGARSYTLSFNSDIDIRGLQDNQRRPLSSLFFTTIWRGYLGWTSNMKQGWYFNTYLQTTNHKLGGIRVIPIQIPIYHNHFILPHSVVQQNSITTNY